MAMRFASWYLGRCWYPSVAPRYSGADMESQPPRRKRAAGRPGPAETAAPRPVHRRLRRASALGVDFDRSFVDDVTVLRLDVPGPKRLTLQFRVGLIDERLADRGWTHCCEHLALSGVRHVRYPMNGFVELARSVF